MTRTRLLALTAAMTAFTGGQVAAQSASMTVRPESKVTLTGSSNVHGWACISSALQGTIELDSEYQKRPMAELTKPISKVAVSIPVKSLKCGNGKMDGNMYKALRANEFPEIRYVLSTYEVTKDLTTVDGFTARTFGDLTVAGTTIRVEIPITALRKEGGTMTGEGTVKLKITDFGIKPPVALLGTLRTKNEIELKFQLQLDRAVVVARTQP